MQGPYLFGRLFYVAESAKNNYWPTVGQKKYNTLIANLGIACSIYVVNQQTEAPSDHEQLATQKADRHEQNGLRMK